MRPRRQLLRAGTVGGACVVIVLAFLLPALSTEGGGQQSSGQALLDLLQQSRSLTYHIRYQVLSDDPQVQASNLELEVWRSGTDRVRHDAIEQAPSSRAETRVVRDRGELSRCSRLDQDPWTCDDGAGDPDLASFDDVVGTVAAALDGAVVTERAEQVRGVGLRCFTISGPTGSDAEICTTEEGIPYLFRFGEARLEWQEHTQGFPPTVFDLPGARAQGNAPPPPPPTPVGVPPAPQPLTLSLSGNAPELELPPPGTTVLPCGAGASTALGHYADLDAEPALGLQPGTIRVNLDVQPDGSGAFLLPDQSSVTFSTPHGALRLDLAAGTCGDTPLSWDGTTATGTGTWTVQPAYTTDGYRETTGSGTFALSARLGPGRDNPWSLDLDGDLTVLQPALTIELTRSYWGRLGADYAGRVLTASFRITNTGPGDAFGVRLRPPTAPEGIEPIEFRPGVLGDLSPGESIEVTLRYRVGLQGGNRGPLLVRRAFDGTVEVTLADALDTEHTLSLPVHVVAPAYPPAL